MKCKLNNVFDIVVIRTQMRTFTRPCQSESFALPERIWDMIRGTFFKPFRWLCMALAVIMFSDNEKQSTASWRERIVERDMDGRSSHVRKRDRPSVVRVLFNIPSHALIWQYSTEIHTTDRIRRDLPSSYQNGRKHGFHSQTPGGICEIL